MLSEQAFSDFLARRGWHVRADLLAETRLQTQRLAFRGLSLRGSGEVRLVDVIGRQLLLLGLPTSLVADRVEIELQVEKSSLFANRRLASILAKYQVGGARVVAVSDTTLSSEAVHTLIQHFHGDKLVSAIYSSADEGLTKRDGQLFVAVATAEKVPLGSINHIGDDVLADVKVPLSMGIAAFYAPRQAHRKFFRLLNGAVAEMRRLSRGKLRAATASRQTWDNAKVFGQHVFGPIVVQFCVLIWLYAIEAEKGHKPCLLFCARGGIGIREAFERTLAKLRLPLEVRRDNIMISRLVVARAALLGPNRSAVEELDREFRGSRFVDVAEALGGRAYELPKIWYEPFQAHQFAELIFGDTGYAVRKDVEEQNALFTRHFKELVRDSDRVILCDTGLYGSTQRLLASAFPDVSIETIQFARSNYKGHSEEHFPRVTGLLVEQNFYNPLSVRSCVLRYWHLIESLFEPAVSSVRTFSQNERGRVVANCGSIKFGDIDPSENNQLLSGALAYIDGLPDNGGAAALDDAEVAWHRLNSAISRPTAAELQCLDVGQRSVDFGRSEFRKVLNFEPGMSFIAKFRLLKAQLWREGAITREFPTLKHAFLPLLTVVLSLRALLARRS